MTLRECQAVFELIANTTANEEVRRLATLASNLIEEQFDRRKAVAA